MKYNKLLLLIPFCMIIFVIMVFYILLNILFDKHAMNIKTIKIKFKDNEPQFNEVIKELDKEDSIFLKNDNGIIYIYIQGEKLKYKDFDKYSKSIELINKLNLESISKESNNIIFCFKDVISFYQAVAHISNKDILYSSYKINRYDNIKGNWYYFDANG